MLEKCPLKMFFCFVSTIGDKNITYLTLIPGELFWVISCVLCLRKRNCRGINIDLADKIDLS